MSGRIVTLLSYGLPILAGIVLAVIFREPVLGLLGIVVAVGIDIGRRIAAVRAKSRVKGGRFVDGRWIDMPDPRERAYLGGMRLGREPDDGLAYLAIDAAMEIAEEVGPKVKQALEERAREKRT